MTLVPRKVLGSEMSLCSSPAGRGNDKGLLGS
jgi:hypothetical protein